MDLVGIDTFFLFMSYIKQLQCDLVMDIGSLDGTNALQFKYALPTSHVIAVEANPYNYRKLKAIERQGVECFHFAASNYDGSGKFYVYNVDYESESANKGMSSLLDALNPEDVKETVDVEVKRLDGFVLSKFDRYTNIALWIDVEGAGYEVIDSLEKISDKVSLIHVEVDRAENRKNQKLENDIFQITERYGFKKDAAVYDPGGKFGDVLFVKRNLKLDTIRPFLMYLLLGQLKLQKIAHAMLPKGVYEKFRKLYCSYLA